jgi:predicted PurR-regulated permease PerM
VVKSTLAHINAQLHTFLAVKLGTSAALGIVATIGLLLLNVPYAYVWGPLVGFLNIIPYIGSIISAIPPIIVAIIASRDVMQGVYVLILVVVLQQIEGNIVTPKLMGDRIKLNVVAVLLSTIIWGYLWGAIGVLLAIPMTATMKVVCDRIEPLRPIAALLG